MRSTLVGAEKRLITFTPKTYIVYDRAFAGKHDINKDINAFFTSTGSTRITLPMDAFLRLEYAFEGTATSGPMPDYDAWLDELPMEALDQRAASADDGWVTTLLAEVKAALFPPKVQADVAARADGELAQLAG